MVSHRAYHAAFLRTMEHFEAKLKTQIVADKKSFVEACASEYRNSGTPNFFHLVDDHQNRLFDSLAAAYRKIVPAFGALGIGQVKSRRMKDAEEDALFKSLADRWVHTEGLKRSKLIADTTEADVLAAIARGIDDGLGTAEIAGRIEDVTELSSWRSAMIATTETHAAANYAGVESVRDAEERLGVKMLKSWLPTLDSRTRPAHADMAGGDPIPLDDTFDVDNEQMDRPGDPTASPENVINCRCTLGFSEADD